MALTRLTFMLRHVFQSSIFNVTQRCSPIKVMTSLASSLLFAIVLFAYVTMSTGLLNSVARPCTWQLEIVADRYSYTDEDVSDAAPLATTLDADDEEDAEEVKGAASLQFMITNRMRRVLEDDLNYHEEEIDMMDPQIASVVIERGLARPLTGMPKSWYKILPSKPILSGLRESVTAGSANFNRVINFTIHKILPFAIPAAGFVYAAPKLFQLLMRSYSLIANFSNKNQRKVKEKQSKQTFSRRVKPEISGQSSITRKNTGVRDGLVGKVSDRVDMKALNSINRSSTFFERIMGK